jgi:hypothetical protein
MSLLVSSLHQQRQKNRKSKATAIQKIFCLRLYERQSQTSHLHILQQAAFEHVLTIILIHLKFLLLYRETKEFLIYKFH